jgi:hypothetical protein
VREKLTVLLWISIAALALRLGWIWWSRHEDAVRMQRAVEAARQGGALPPELEGNALKILSFYAESGEIAAGDRDLMCYGVVNAKRVTLTPDVEQVYPALNRCFWVTPQSNTKYTLTAEGQDGATVSSSLEIRVRK